MGNSRSRVFKTGPIPVPSNSRHSRLAHFPSRLSPENETGNSQINNTWENSRLFPEFSTGQEISCSVLKYVSKIKTKQSIGEWLWERFYAVCHKIQLHRIYFEIMIWYIQSIHCQLDIARKLSWCSTIYYKYRQDFFFKLNLLPPYSLRSQGDKGH